MEEEMVVQVYLVQLGEGINRIWSLFSWELVSRPQNQSVIGTRWVFRNKMDENGIIVRNIAKHN